MWVFINNRPIRPRSKISICVRITNEYKHRYERQNTLAFWRSLFAEIEQGDVIEFSLLKYTIALYFYMTMKYTKVCLHDTYFKNPCLTKYKRLYSFHYVCAFDVRSTYLLYCLSVVEADAKVGGLAESKHKIGLYTDVCLRIPHLTHSYFSPCQTDLALHMCILKNNLLAAWYLPYLVLNKSWLMHCNMYSSFFQTYFPTPWSCPYVCQSYPLAPEFDVNHISGYNLNLSWNDANAHRHNKMGRLFISSFKHPNSLHWVMHAWHSSS